MIHGSSSDNLNTSLRDTGLRFSPIVTVDEIHNFCGKVSEQRD